jgi:carbon storage regulator
MLVLSRYRDESIHIGDNVVVTIVDIRGDRVRLGIQAPSDVAVHRQEIYDAIVREKNNAENDTDLEKSPPKKPTELTKKSKKYNSPLAKKLEVCKGKKPPVNLDTASIGFRNGINDIVSQ